MKVETGASSVLQREGDALAPGASLHDLTPEHYEQRAAKVRAAGAQGLHLFNETRKEMMKGL